MIFTCTITIKMKTLVLLAVLGVVCITYSAATPYSYNQENRLLSSLQRLSSRDSVVEEQENDDDTALAQIYLRLLENEVQKQDMSNEDRAEMESIFSNLKQKFKNFGNKVAGGFRKIKSFFHKG